MAQGHLKSENQDDLEKPLLDTSDSNSNSKVEVRGCDTVTPYASAGFFRSLTFSWLNPLLALGAKKTTLDLDDVPQLDNYNSVFEAFPVLQNRLRDNVAKKSSSGVTTEFMLVKALFLSAWKEILWTAILSIAFTLARYVPPYLIDSFVQCLNGQENFKYQGYILALTFPIATLVEGFIRKHSAFKLQQVGIRLRAATTATIFNKCLKSSNKHTSGSGNGGELINVVAVDVETLNEFICEMHDPWLIILQIALALVILNKNLGILASVAALAMQVCFMLLNSVYVKWQERFQKELMECKDNRMKVTMETLRNMRILKLQGWQTSFLSKIFQLRKVEVSWLKKYLYFSAMMDAFYGVSSTLVALVAFGSCYLMGIPLETGMILSALATFAALQAPVNYLPETVSMLIQAKVSVRRIASILSRDQLQDNALEKLPLGSSGIAIEIVNGNFIWDKLDNNSVTLKDINLKLFHGMRVAVCGTVGSGKSSLLSSILGEIPKISGTVSLCGSTAYVAQSPWIQSATVRENVLFGKDMNSERYKKVLEACCLNKDLEILPYGDQTVIGERGINLSGGQKQRVQIARALYHDADVFLFDDPFSAVDAHTGSHLFKEVLLGLLSEKTVIYVTHQVEFLNAADLIVVMKDGRISQVGKYDDILLLGSDFMQLVGAQNAALSAFDSVVNEGIVEHEKEDKSLQNVETNHEGAASASLQSAAQLIKEEEREKGKVAFQIYWKYITTTYGGSLLLLSILGNIVCRFLRIGSSFWLAWAAPISKDVKPPVDASTLMTVYACLAVAISLCNLAAEMLRVTAGYKTAITLFIKMLERIFNAPMSFFDATPSGRILSRCSSDQKALEMEIPLVLDGLTYNIIALLGIITLMAAVSWEVLFIFIPMFLVSLWYQQYYMPTSRELTRLSGVCQAPITQYFAETITGLTTIRGFDQASRFQTTYMKVIESYSRPEFHLAATLKWLLLRLDAFSCITFAFLLVLSVYFAEGIDPAITGLAVTYGLTLSNSISAVTRCLCNLENRMISLERIFQYMSIPSEAPLVIQENRPDDSWPSCGEVDIHELEVRYAPHLPIVLHGVTCTFQGGMRTGIVGRTGSGKSTLIQALFRIVEPTSGRIVIDGIDISNIGLQDLRSRLSIIPQDPTMFQGTIRSNLDPLEQYTDEKIWEALDKCQLGEEVRKTERKLDSIVNENGENWSMGQRQLVCLGRVLVKKSKVLVLDEATASVDTATDNLIQQTLKHHFYDCTIITIAHRITSILDSDMVLLLDNGFVKEYDSPGRLLQNKSSSFAQLVAEYTSRSSDSHHFETKSTRDQ